MEDNRIVLALAFLQSQPRAAATILEQQPLEQVAIFLSQVPHTHGAKVLGKMLPQYTARLCGMIEPTVVAGMLSEMSISLVAAVLRHCDGELSQILLGLLPEKNTLACRFLLNYSEDSVGAWMMANISTLPDDCNVEEARSRIAAEQGMIDFGATLVIDRDRLVKGVVSLATLMRSPPNAPISVAVNRNSDSLAARMALNAAANHPFWANRDAIPVTNRDSQLVGILRHLDLRRGLDQLSTTIVQPQGADPITGIYETYGNSMLALFDTLSDMSSARIRRN
jgi:Mg/Co/Ni transporter MgtE